jgi:hypothetical protein
MGQKCVSMLPRVGSLAGIRASMKLYWIWQFLAQAGLVASLESLTMQLQTTLFSSSWRLDHLRTITSTSIVRPESTVELKKAEIKFSLPVKEGMATHTVHLLYLRNCRQEEYTALQTSLVPENP